MRADDVLDVLVEAALAMHGASITRHDLAMAMQWELARVERALRALEVLLAGTGLCLSGPAAMLSSGRLDRNSLARLTLQAHGRETRSGPSGCEKT